MTDQIYTLGYTGRRPGEIYALAEQLDATVCDIRFSPRSRVPRWNKGRLEVLLGDRYMHIQELGNQNYKTGGPVEIVDLDAGLARIQDHPRPVILMCACKDLAGCHRAVIRDHLRAEGLEVEELF